MNVSTGYLNGWLVSSLAAVSIAVAPGSATAQSVTAGVRVGLTASAFSNDDSDDSKLRLGASPGVFVDFNVNPRIAIRLEGAYAMKGVKGDRSSATLDYIEAPILLSVRPSPGRSVVLHAGLAPARKVRAQYQSDFGTKKYGDLVHAFDLGLVLGVGVGPVDVRYTRGSTPVFNFNDPEDSDSDDKNQTISIGVSLALFGKSRPSTR